MKDFNFFSSTYGRVIPKSVSFPFLFVFLITIAGADAEGTLFREPVTEAGLVRMLPVLKAEAREILLLNQNSESGDAARSEEFISMLDSVYAATGEIKSGELNPLECLSSYSRYLAVPSGVTFDTDASRIESVFKGLPSVVFTFGIDASAFGLAVIHNDIEALKKMNAVGKIDSTSDNLKMSSILETVREFYRERNFIENGMTGPLAWSFTSPDSMLAIDFYEANILIYHGCTMLPSGPLIEISCRGIPGMEGDPSTVIAPDMPAMLERTAISIEDYFNFKSDLLCARDDTQDPKRLKLDAPDSSQSPESGETFEKLARMIQTRKMNADLYSRYAGILGPLLSALDGRQK
ncbi:MAG: hypothetical protein WCU00_03265 [Candidatus Latescibacterota bacterium]